MVIVNTINQIEQVMQHVRMAGQRVGFVPTMGALHAGHISLVQRSVAENDFTAVSVFVNPTQFNNPQDLEKYPRDLAKDEALLFKHGCDLIFAPSPTELYSEADLKTSFEFDFGGLDQMMEGKHRPRHFNGVVQIVSKLFKIIQADKAYFGEKDFQQLAIIHHMTKVMGFDIQIIDCPIIREKSGLAMSSRNERLSPEEREIAANISKVLFESLNFVPSLSPKQLEQWVANEIRKVSGLDLEYYEIVDTKSLQPAVNWEKSTVGCIAVYCGGVRLIDNIRCS